MKELENESEALAREHCVVARAFIPQEGVLSVLAGDVFRGTPLGPRLLAFKAIYYLTNLFNLRRTLNAWITRKQMLREPSAETTAG